MYVKCEGVRVQVPSIYLRILVFIDDSMVDDPFCPVSISQR